MKLSIRNALDQISDLLSALPHSAVPFEEDDKDPSIWFLDHSYLENMFRMFKKVNGKQHFLDDPNLITP